MGGSGKMSEKILVLGTSGMLGSVVFKYLEKSGHNVEAITKDMFNIYDRIEVLENFISKDVTYIVNCVGIIKPRADKIPVQETIKVNSLFPLQLSDLLTNLRQKNIYAHLIHISTDCVFTGSLGNYSNLHFSDAEDLYGISKAVGEYCKYKARVIRTSIIGEEKNNKYSLLEWAKSQAGTKVQGWSNHIWSGVTTLQLAKFISGSIYSKQFFPGIYHYVGDPINKFELLKIINEVYDLNLNIQNIYMNDSCDRSLAPETEKFICRIPPLKEQLIELKEFFEKWM